MMRHNSIPAGLGDLVAPPVSHAHFSIGDVVRHRVFDFRGVIFDVDPVFTNTEDDEENGPVDHPALSGIFTRYEDGRYQLRREHRH
jgi:heat shock protein HspQ